MYIDSDFDIVFTFAPGPEFINNTTPGYYMDEEMLRDDGPIRYNPNRNRLCWGDDLR